MEWIEFLSTLFYNYEMAQTKEGAIKVAAKKAEIPVAEYKRRVTLGLKRCTACKAWKPREEFDVDRSRYDGKTAGCIPCRRVSVRRERIKSSETKSAIQKAHDAVRWSIRRGTLSKPTMKKCKCGKRAAQYHHSRSYAGHELDVEPMCLSCHRKAHWNG